ncbi:hypothetical protein PUN28_010619 [Cardiocondyla obscurior]|uniref:Uncharacterized protein n=1 Tax=Cardiocondyla obscurior TaxID=286306 RepID=A0AAW2FJE4_9HYME
MTANFYPTDSICNSNARARVPPSRRSTTIWHDNGDNASHNISRGIHPENIEISSCSGTPEKPKKSDRLPELQQEDENKANDSRGEKRGRGCLGIINFNRSPLSITCCSHTSKYSSRYQICTAICRALRHAFTCVIKVGVSRIGQ